MVIDEKHPYFEEIMRIKNLPMLIEKLKTLRNAAKEKQDSVDGSTTRNEEGNTFQVPQNQNMFEPLNNLPIRIQNLEMIIQKVVEFRLLGLEMERELMNKDNTADDISGSALSTDEDSSDTSDRVDGSTTEDEEDGSPQVTDTTDTTD